jgi:subtilisin family serine protease
MRALFAFISFVLLGTTNLAAQVLPPPVRPPRAAPETKVYLVTFRRDTPASQRAAAVQASGARLKREYTSVGAVSVEIPDVAALNRLRNDPRVLSVFSNRPITFQGAQGHSGGGGAAGNSGGAKPKAPTNLVATATSSSQITLAWTDTSDNETGFAVERCAGSGCTNYSEITRVNPNIITFADTGLTAQATYRYRVLAFNAAGNSKYSNIADATTAALQPAPSAPTNLTSSAVSYNQINLSWSDSSTNEDGFRLERCNGISANCLDANFTEIPQLGANVTSYSDVGLQGQTTYTYRIRAFNSVGPSGYSNATQATTLAPPPPPPSAPTNLTASVVSDSQINLNWSDTSTTEDGFRIERCIDTAANCVDIKFVQIAQFGANVTTFSNFGLQAQTTYTYRVRAFSTAGFSAYSNVVQATTQAAPPSTQVVPSGVQRIGAAPGMMNWTGAGIGVAVVDTGVDFNHADLGLAPEIPGLNSFNAVGGSCQDFHGHGTHVAGIIAARNNAIDVVGVAPNATIYCVSVFQPDPDQGAVGTDEDLIAGLDWIATHANLVNPPIRVVNMSLGREKTVDDDNPNHPVHLAVKALYDMGISVVVAAGNDPLREVTDQVPAGYPEVMAIASTTAQDGVNGYDEEFPACVGVPIIKTDTASYFTTDGAFLGGTGVTASAPGEQQEDIFLYADACFLEPIGILSLALDGGTVELAGTSMASPHVAGVVALMWEHDLSLGISLTPEGARTRIRNNVQRRGTAPLDSPLEEYTFDGEREGVIWAPAAVGDVPPPPEDQHPAVTILSPATESSFGPGANITFQGTASDPEDGDIAASLTWTSSRDGQIGTGANFTRTLSSGSHVITATVSDSGGNTASASTSITIGSSSTPTTVQASSVTYAMQGTTLLYTVTLVNEFGGPVPNASVEVDLMEWVFTGYLWISSGTTNSQGKAQFQLPNADIGCYVTAVRNVVAAGLTWIPGTPSNNFCLF